MLSLWFLTYELDGETGWRGFALPHLQRYRPPPNVAVLLGLLWAARCLPAFFLRDT